MGRLGGLAGSAGLWTIAYLGAFQHIARAVSNHHMSHFSSAFEDTHLPLDEVDALCVPHEEQRMTLQKMIIGTAVRV